MRVPKEEARNLSHERFSLFLPILTFTMTEKRYVIHIDKRIFQNAANICTVG